MEVAAFVAWRRVAGEGLRVQAVPFRLYRKTLIVSVMDVTWQKQLEPMSGQLLFRLNSLLGQAVVTYIEFRIDPQTSRRAHANAGRNNRTEQERRALQSIAGEILRLPCNHDDACAAVSARAVAALTSVKVNETFEFQFITDLVA